MTNIAIKIENLSKIYKLYPSHAHRLKEALHPFRRKYHTEFYAINNLNLSVKKSEVLGIVGRNGAGKSTLLKIISGVSPPTDGHVWVNGNISALLELGSGFNPEFTGIENVFFSGSVMGFSRKQMDAKLSEILSFADIGDFVYQPFKTYSSGMKTRLAFAVATSIDPEILIIDEVLSVGDELFRRKCYARIEKFMLERKTILLITHDIRTINELCTRALILDKGEIILIGPSKLVTTQYQRFIYAKPNSAQKIRNDIIRLNQNDELKYAIAKESHKKNVRNRQKNDKHKYNESVIKEKPENDSKVKNLINFKSEYLPNLKPKSTVEYKNYDVEINDVEIRTLEGKIVNSLIMDEEYIYSYKVKFNIDAENVVFSMSIKNEKGSDLSSAKTSAKEIIRHVQKCKDYTIDWRFLCTLLPGTYYTNVGVTSFPKDDKFLILNRIIDAIVFKVQKNNEIPYTGFCHLNQSVKIYIDEEDFFKN